MIRRLSQYKSNIGCDFFTKEIEINGKQINLQVKKIKIKIKKNKKKKKRYGILVGKKLDLLILFLEKLIF